MNERSDGRRHRFGGWTRAFRLAIATPALLNVIVIPVDDEVRAVGDRSLHADSGDELAVATDEMSMNEMLANAERWTGSLEIQGRDLEAYYWSEVDPLVRDLIWLGADSVHAKRIAVALMREGIRADIDPRLLLAVMRVENPWLDLYALSPVGAVGLMQVMPFHAGGWGCGGSDLTDLDLNICHGTKILARLLDRFDGDLERALLLYNGCVRGSNTSDCHLYPSWVLGHTGAWADQPIE